MTVVEARLDLAESLRLWDEAVALIPGGSQTNSKRPANYAFGQYPIYAARAKGARIWDVDGNEYLDYVNGLGPISLGYDYPAVTAAVRDQLDRGTISGLLWPAEVTAARALTQVIPCAEQVRFFKGGGEATAAAARIARGATGRHVILNCGYRGWPDTWSAGHDDAVPPPLSDYVLSFPFGDAAAVERLLAQQRGKVAAVFLGMPYEAEADAGYLAAVRDLAHAHGALLVYDEIVTGFRLATGGGQEYHGVVPDLAVFAKGMANGMPLAAVVGRREVMGVAERLLISITFGGEALSLAACTAVVREYRERDVVGHLWRTGRQLMDGLNAAADEIGVPFRSSGYASMAAMRLDVPRECQDEAWFMLLAECARRGVLLRRGGLNNVTLAHTADDIAETIVVCREAFKALYTAGFRGAATAADGRQRVGSQQVGIGAASGR